MNVDPESLEVVISDRKLSPLAIPTAIDGGLVRMPPMWEAIYFHYLYAEHYRHQTKVSPKNQAAACLAPPPAWLVGIAAVMWEGILQGAAWDVVKMSVGAAISKLQGARLAPQDSGSKETDISVKAGWRTYSSSGKKQYEMFLSLKRTIKRLPEGHALAYARAADATEFGRIVRNELKVVPAKSVKSPGKTLTKAKTKASRKRV